MLLLKVVGRALFALARSRVGGWIVGPAFAYAVPLMPVRKLVDTDIVVAFHHPRPSYPIHVLIVPKRRVSNLLALDGNGPIMPHVIAVAQRLVRELKLDQQGYQLLVNGGAYQDVRQLHFHLIAGRSL